MGKIEEIVENGLNKIDLDWYKAKNEEFRMSKLWVEKSSLHQYSESERMDLSDEEKPLQFENDFREYCKIPLLTDLEYDITNQIQVTKESYTGSEPIRISLNEITIEVVDRLEPFFKIVDPKDISDFINNVYDCAIATISSNTDKSENTDHFLLKRDLVEMIRLELDQRNAQKLEVAKFLKTNWNKLRFKLTLEDLSALIKILEKGEVIFETNKEIVDFAEKHFVYKAQGTKEFQLLLADRLAKAMEKHGTPSHKGKGLENIHVKIINTIATIQKPGK
jgi:hypothetical protein